MYIVPKLQDNFKTQLQAFKNIQGEKVSLENKTFIPQTFKALFKIEFIALNAFTAQQV